MRFATSLPRGVGEGRPARSGGAFAAGLVVAAGGVGWLVVQAPVLGLLAGAAMLAVAGLAALGERAPRVVLVGTTAAVIALAAGFGLRLSVVRGSYDRGVLVARVLGFALVAVVTVATRGRVLRPLVAEGWLLGLLAIGLVSLFWSANPAATVRSVAGFATALSTGAILAAEFRRRDAVRLVAAVLLAASAVSLALLVVAPGRVHVSIYRVRVGTERVFAGAFEWNSALGVAAGLGLVLAVGLCLAGERRVWWGAVPVCALALLLSRSATALLAAAAGCLALVALRSRSRLVGYTAGGGAVAAVFGYLASSGAIVDAVVAALGRDPSLTGRTAIWDIARTRIAERWLLGRGLGGGGSAFEGLLGFATDHAHNGFVQLLLDLGLLGATPFVVAVVIAATRLIRVARRADAVAEHVATLGGVLVFALVANLANNYILAAHLVVAMLAWVLFSARDLAAPAR